MVKILVSMVSKETIPNIILIRHVKPDRLLFISTPEMQRKGKVTAILNSLKRAGLDYGELYDEIIVENDNIADIHNKLIEWIRRQEDVEFLVNITCGTKIMSIGTYEFFKDYGCRLGYIPLGKNEFLTIFPKRVGREPERLPVRLTVMEYLDSYGLRVKNAKKLRGYRDEAFGKRETSCWIVEHYMEILNLLKWFWLKLHKARDKKIFSLNASYGSPSDAELELLRKLGFQYTDRLISKRLRRSELKYLTGGWLEEFCFNEIASLLGSGIDDVEIGIKVLNEQGRDNELDVMFTKENVLYFVECKSLDQQDDRRQNQALYKIGALQKDFGLSVRSFLVTTAPDIMHGGRIRESVKARGEQFSTVIVTPDKVSRFGEELKKELKL